MSRILVYDFFYHFQKILLRRLNIYISFLDFRWDLMGISWGSHGDLMGISWGSHGDLMGISWGLSWGSHGDFRGDLMGTFVGISWGSHGDLMGISWGSHGNSYSYYKIKSSYYTIRTPNI